MGNVKETLNKILKARSDANISFNDICNLLIHLDFEVRISGSHHIFRRPDIEEKINLQKDGNQAKPYQVRQVRYLIIKYNLGEELDE
ncbi:type II toxin-antitoxin system HicA family toxin [candidate division KSB1 bacterium]|nr:type II toxin-antitoxin system HicA family toxin [candidate division KSB1 bacterium]